MLAYCRCMRWPIPIGDPLYDTLRCLKCGHDARPVRVMPSTRRLALAIASALMDSGSRVGAAQNPDRLTRTPYGVHHDLDVNRYHGGDRKLGMGRFS